MVLNSIINKSLTNRILDTSKKIYKKSNLRCKHITFIIYKKRIVSIGVNYKKTTTIAAQHGYKYPFQHSELAALKKITFLNYKKSKLVLINIRVSNKDNLILNSKPCKNCKRVIKSFGISSVYYSIDGGEFSCLV